MFRKLLFKHYIKKHEIQLMALKSKNYIVFVSAYDFHSMLICDIDNYSHYTTIILKNHPKTKFYPYPNNAVLFVK